MSSERLTPAVGERAHDHVLGQPHAPITLVEYGDFECPYCGQAYPIVKSLQRQLGNQLRFVFRNFPLGEVHPHAEHAAEAAEAAGAQDRFWVMHDTLYEHQDALDDSSLRAYAAASGVNDRDILAALQAGSYAKLVREDFRSGVRSGVNGTPTFFINGARYDGQWADESVFLAALHEVAAAAD